MKTTLLAWLTKRRLEDPAPGLHDSHRLAVSRRARLGRRFGQWFVRTPHIRDHVPARSRPALYFESLYNVGAGGFLALFLLTPVALKTVVDGSAEHLALFSAMFGGSSLLSPLVSYCGRRIKMRSLVVYPCLAVAACLLATASPVGGATFFTLAVGSAFVVRVFPRVAEMNMYRVVYSPTHRGSAVGWLKALSAIAMLSVTLFGYWWFSFQPSLYWVVYCLVAVLLVVGAWSYSHIPIPRRNLFARPDAIAPHRAFWQGLRLFLDDGRFVLYQFGFALAGFANHMALIFVAEILREDVIGTRTAETLLPPPFDYLVFTYWGLDWQTAVSLIVGLIIALLPALLMMTSALFWGRFLDRVNPMIGRTVFNLFQAAAYGFHAYGGYTLQIWPFLVGTSLHAIGNGGGTINWLTGSLYFAKPERVSLYNAVHVALTGLRGLIAPICGLYLIGAEGLGLGPGIFVVAVVLSLAGASVMLFQGLTDPGPREGRESRRTPSH